MNSIIYKCIEGSKTCRTWHTCIVNTEHSLCIVNWQDNRDVTLISNFKAIEPIGKAKRWSKSTKSWVHVPCPEIILQETLEQTLEERSEFCHEIRFDNIGHFPMHLEANSTRKRCKNCGNGLTLIKCMKCNVFLCLNANRNCFFPISS